MLTPQGVSFGAAWGRELPPRGSTEHSSTSPMPRASRPASSALPVTGRLRRNTASCFPACSPVTRQKVGLRTLVFRPMLTEKNCGHPSLHTKQYKRVSIWGTQLSLSIGPRPWGGKAPQLLLVYSQQYPCIGLMVPTQRHLETGLAAYDLTLVWCTLFSWVMRY